MIMYEDQTKDVLPIKTQKIDTMPVIDNQTLQVIGNMETVFDVMGVINNITIPVFTSYDIKEDFEWYSSGQVDVSSFKGKYIAIWRKQIVGSGDSALEAERIAKAYNDKWCRPAIIYIPENDESIL